MYFTKEDKKINDRKIDSLKKMMQAKLKRHISTTRLGDYIDNNVKSSIEKLEIESHLNKCKTCKEVVRQLKALNEEWENYEEKILLSSPGKTGLKKLKTKLLDSLASIKKLFQTVLNTQWIQVSLATATVAVIIFFMVKVFQTPVDETKPFQENIFVEEKDSLKSEDQVKLADEQKKSGEIKKQESIIEKKTPDNWEKIKQAFAENFKPTPYLEEMLAYESRSYANNIISPKIGEKCAGAILFQWEKIEEKPIYLKILNNKGTELFSLIPENNQYRFSKKLTPGLYYWKLESENDVLYVGKFLAGS